MDDFGFWWLTPLILALMVGVICPTTGALLITQRRILLANLMAHSVLPGLVLALAFELDPLIGGLLSGLLGALLAEQLNHRFKGREEGAMNTVLAGFTALGVLLVPLLQARIDLEALLFGDMLAGSGSDVIRTLVAAAALLLLLLSRYQDLVFLGVDQEGAIAARRPVMQIRFITILITALVVISAITAVGVVLVIALLCAPVLVNLDRSESLRVLMLRSAGTGVLLSSGGLMLAILLDLPPGPLIGVLCLVLLLFWRR
ncbi:MAG: metal ABC transporter permease [Cyanobacteriota bacterium]|nr:metal ABC transporter permease [Cyanobacteriota bacterium]